MPSKRRHTYLFPQKFILLTSFGLCLCAAADILLAVISSNNKLKGYYYWTGFWCGGSIFVTGVLGIVSSCLRSVSVVKAFMILCIAGLVVSLAVIALSVVGIDVNNTFYRVHRENSLLDVIYHGGLIGIGVVQLVLCILCDIACLCYIFAVKSKRNVPDDCRRNRPSIVESNVPLIKNQSVRNSYCQTDEGNIDDSGRVKQEHQFSLGLLNDNPSRFSTFGRKNANYQISNNRIGNTVETVSLDYPDEDEYHYAQIQLFERPLPIEDDEELPPYRRVDPRSKRLGQSNKTSQLRRTNSMPTFSNKRVGREKHARMSERKDLSQRSSEVLDKSPGKQRSKDHRERNLNITKQQSRSSDLLELEGKTIYPTRNVNQKQTKPENRISRRDKNITNEETVVKLRSSSLRTDHTKKLNRRRRAYSAEYKFSKENIAAEDEHLLVKTSSIEDWNSALFAPNRIIPTKFSLRTRMRQDGTPAVISAIPVKPVSSPPPLISPPPKPPRTLLGKNKCFHTNVNEADAKLENQIFIFPKVESDSNETIVESGKLKLQNEDGKQDSHSSPKVAIEPGPVLKCNLSPNNITSQSSVEKSNEIQSKKDNKDSFPQTDFKTAAEIPTSPIVKCPPPMNKTQKTPVVKSSTAVKVPTSPSLKDPSIAGIPTYAFVRPRSAKQLPISPTVTSPSATSLLPIVKSAVELPTPPIVKQPSVVEIPTTSIATRTSAVGIPTSPIAKLPSAVEKPTSPIVKCPSEVELPTSPIVKCPTSVEISTSPIVIRPPAFEKPISSIVNRPSVAEIPTSPTVKLSSSMEVPISPVVKCPITPVQKFRYAGKQTDLVNDKRKTPVESTALERPKQKSEVKPVHEIIQFREDKTEKLYTEKNIDTSNLRKGDPQANKIIQIPKSTEGSLIQNKEPNRKMTVFIKTENTIPKNEVTSVQCGDKSNTNPSDKGARPKTNIRNVSKDTSTPTWDRRSRVPVFIPITTAKNTKQPKSTTLYTRPSSSPRLINVQSVPRSSMSASGNPGASQTQNRNRVQDVEEAQNNRDVANGSQNASQSSDDRDALYAKIL